MVNIMHSLYTSVDGLRINQAGLSVVSNNIANMNTEGFSKQRIELQSLSYRAGSNSQLLQMQPGGVSIDRVTRYQDDILNGFIMQENSVYGYDQQMTANLTYIEGYMNEIDGSGITGALQDYFEAAQSLANDPTNKVARSNFVYQAENVAKEFNSKYNDLISYRENLVGDGITSTSVDNSQVGHLTEDINNKLTQIVELNRQIAIFSSQQNVQPNSLLDKRQLLLDELAQQIPITLRNQGPSIDIYMGNVQLVEDDKQLGFFKAVPGGATNPGNPAVVTIVDKDDNLIMEDYQAEFSTEQGKLKAILDVAGDTPLSIYQLINQLNTLAQEFARNVNSVQLSSDAGPPPQASLSLNTTTNTLEPATENIFLNDPVTTGAYDVNLITAGNIVINSVVKANPFEVATAYGAVDVVPNPTVATNPEAVGNNNNALEFLKMRQLAIATLDGLTVEDKLYSIASQVGNDSSLMQARLDTQQNSLDQLYDKKQSLDGVSLDEELVDLLKYQKAYQAAAKVFSTVTQMMEVITNMVR